MILFLLASIFCNSDDIPSLGSCLCSFRGFIGPAVPFCRADSMLDNSVLRELHFRNSHGNHGNDTVESSHGNHGNHGDDIVQSSHGNHDL